MFSRLKLTNFKAWKDTGDVALRPVTMLLGTNSSGKSSLIQSLLLLKQTVQSPDRSIHLNLGGDETDDLYDFGGFDSVLRGFFTESESAGTLIVLIVLCVTVIGDRLTASTRNPT